MPDPTPATRDREKSRRFAMGRPMADWRNRLITDEQFIEALAEFRAQARQEGREEALTWRRRGSPEPHIDTRKNDRPLAVVRDKDGWIGVATIMADGRWLRRGKRAMYQPEFFLPIPNSPAPSGAKE